MTADDVRLAPETLDRYFAAGVPTQHLLSRDPRIQMRIDPRAQELALSTHHDGTDPDLAGLQRVHADVEDHEDGTWSVLRIDARDMRYEAYGMLVAVAESLRQGTSFSAAVQAALANFRHLLAGRRRLSEEQERGLFGELLVLESMHATRGTDALEWWLGPLAEQHDFACPGYDLEVKTTVSDRRKHRIAGVDQLLPNPGRPLWLVSIQITRAGGAEGLSLAELVRRVQALFPADDRFRTALQDLGWREEDADLYSTTYLLRSTPRAFLIDDEFPAITFERLRATVPHADLLSEISYRVDVTDRPAGTPGPEVAGFLTPKGTHA